MGSRRAVKMLFRLIKIACCCAALARLFAIEASEREWIETNAAGRPRVKTAPVASLEARPSDELASSSADLGWEYEPRAWTPDADEAAGGSELEDLELLEEILRENSSQLDDKAPDFGRRNDKQPAPSAHSANNSATGSGGGGNAQANSNNNNSDSTTSSYFWDARRRHYGKLEVLARQGAGGTGDKCTQFRVDIRETVICDKRRCDKLDFEWPKHPNQLVVIETTKHGMRFHRSEYEFKDVKQHQHQAASFVRKRGGSSANATRISPPVKFDLFELFKPKPTSAPVVSSPAYNYLTSTTTTSATTATTATTSAASTTTTTTSAETTTSSDGQPETTTTTTTASPTDADGATGKPTTASSQPLTEAADQNQTRLVTTFRVNTRRKMQKIIGFGGALSDATCRNIKSLSPAMARSLMEDYFGPRGLRYTIARMSMGSSDFSTSPYTNNDRPLAGGAGGPAKTEADQEEDKEEWRRRRPWRHWGSKAAATSTSGYDEADDVEMKNFHLTEEDYEFKLPVARQAIATSQTALKFYASLWSPPTWMKNNSNIVHGWLKGDVYGPYYKALAELMVKWLEAYRRQGIEFWATTGLNEPVTGVKPFIFHNSLGITRSDYVTFIKLYLGPMLRQRNFHNLKLIALDDNKGYAPTWARALLDDQEAAKYVAGVGVHWYMNDEYENLNFLVRDFPEKFALSTEACNGYLPFQTHVLPGDWDRGVAYLLDILKLMHRNVAGWVDWNMALDLAGGPSWIKNNVDAPVIVNAERDEYYKSPMFYAIGHFSRFVEPDSFRLDHRLAYAKYDYPLEAAAYLTPKEQVVIVVLNANKHPVPFRVIVDRQVIRVVDLKADSFSTIIFNWKGRNS